MRNTLFLYLALTAPIAYGQAGTLDLTYDTDGFVFTDVTTGEDDVIRAITIQPDGKILAAGYTSDGVSNQFALARYNDDGTLDNSFDSDGMVVTSFPSTAIASAVALQPDGKIVAAGHAWGGSVNEFALVRYHSDGSLDNGFGSGGFVLTDFGSMSAIIRSIALQPDGKLVVAGFVYQIGIDNDDFALARYNQDGTPDSTFGTNGKVITTFTSNSKDNIRNISLQANGKIVAVGYSDAEGAMVRYDNAGNPDITFGSNGKLTTLTGGQTVYNAVHILNNGHIAVAGFSNDTMNNFLITQYDTNGILDASFGNSGTVVTKVSAGNDGANALVVQPDGKYLVCGTAQNGSVFDFGIVRYHTSGIIDSTFGTNGIVKTPLGNGLSEINSACLQADGKLVAGGYKGEFPNDFALARYITNAPLGAIDFRNTIQDLSLYPNPVLGSTITVTCTVIFPANLTIAIVDGSGKLLAVLSERDIKAGNFLTTLPLPENLSGGNYFLKIEAGEYGTTIPFIIGR